MRHFFLQLIFFTLISHFMSACGFYVAPAVSQVNASIDASKNSLFAQVLKKHLNPSLTPTLSVEIQREKQQKSIANYRDGIASGYYLVLYVPVKVYKNKQLILQTTLTRSRYLSDSATTLAGQLQQQTQYNYLRNALVSEFAKRLNLLSKTHSTLSKNYAN